MPVTTWAVVGGSRSGGVVVREGEDTSSPTAPDRLSTGALVKQLAVAAGNRLQYQLLSGTGPETGWVSTKFKGEDLLVQGKFWKVVGGGKSGGIMVKEGRELASAEVPERIATGALLKELDLQKERLQFEKLIGAGPQTGWVSLKLKANTLVAPALEGESKNASAAPASTAKKPTQAWASTDQIKVPLEIVMSNEEKEFSYEGLPRWVPQAAAVAKLWRDGKPYLPPDEPPLPRLALIKMPTPFKKLPPKKLREAFKTNPPGDIYGLPFPQTAQQMTEDPFGADWFTKAFHAAGTLPKDNKISKLVSVKELSIDGFAKDGGAAMKCRIKVEYEKPSPELHTDLFAKYTYDPAREVAGQITIGQDDSLEVLVNAMGVHLFPFRAPQFYYGDICRENTAYLIITESIPYASKDQKDFQPYEVLPGCGKCQDFLLQSPVDVYLAIFRAKGRMAAWDKQGRYDSILGERVVWGPEEFLKNNPPPKQPKQSAEISKKVIGDQVEKIIDFFMTWCPKMAPPQLRNRGILTKVKDELVAMSPWFRDMSGTYQQNNSDYVVAAHANLQADNAWFWRDEYGDLTCGVLDWGGFSRSPCPVRWLGCLTGADVETLLAHEEGIIQCFVDEYHRCGGPKLDLQETILRFRLAFITNCFDGYSFIERHTYKETSLEDFLKFTGPRDPDFQERFFTRCGCLPTINAWNFYIQRGDMKDIFDKWAAGAGKPFMTIYE